MAWTSLTFSYGSVLTSTKMTQMQANFQAVADGDSGAPNIQTAGIAASAVTSAKIAASNVVQGKLAVSTQQQTAVFTSLNISFTGGAYTLGWGLAWDGATGNAKVEPYTGASGYTAGIHVAQTAGGSPNYWFQANYITASPPYDLGDGDIPLFIYAEVTPGGQVVRVDVAQDPPWIYNGPNRLNPHKLRYDDAGRAFYKQRAILAEHGSIARAVAAGMPIQTALARMQTDAEQEVEITRVRKNLDMPAIPHPFRDAAPGNTVVLLDPVSPGVERLALLHALGDPDMQVGKLLMAGDLRIGNTALPRRTPNGVMPVSVSFR